MNDGGDIVALYGAILSTVIALIQYFQWKKSQQAILVTWDKDFQGPKFHLEVTISNLRNFPVYLEFIDVGYTYRPWFKPWLVKPFEIPSMKATDGDCLSKRCAGGQLKPSEAIDVWFDSSDFRSLQKPHFISGFRRHISIWVDHSGDDKSFHKRLKWIR